jgi:NAD-dependent dihydropyrimidine dehydrogenase PreA subunit
MKKLILMVATIGAITFANAQAPTATPAKAATPAPAAPAAVDPNAPEIKWETKNIDFGTVTKGDETNSTRYFKFTNTGKTPLIISSCHGSCGCTVPSCPTESIMPGKNGEIKVHYDINRLGNFTKTVTVSSNAKNNNETLQITGKVEEKAGAPAPAAPGAPVKK